MYSNTLLDSGYYFKVKMFNHATVKFKVNLVLINPEMVAAGLFETFYIELRYTSELNLTFEFLRFVQSWTTGDLVMCMSKQVLILVEAPFLS